MRIEGMPVLAGGDILIAIENVPVKKFDDLINYLARETEVGDVVSCSSFGTARNDGSRSVWKAGQRISKSSA